MHAVILHLTLMLIWMLLSPGRSTTDLILGFALGFLLLWAFKSVLNCEPYVGRVLNFFRFALSFTWAFITANIAMAKMVLFQPIDDIRPEFIALDLSGLRDFEIVLLTHSISLTPGTTSVEVSTDKTRLIVHCMDARDPDAVRRDIDTQLRAPLLAFTRDSADPLRTRTTETA